MTANDVSGVLTSLSTTLSSYVPAILAFIGITLGIRVGAKWVKRFGRSA